MAILERTRKVFVVAVRKADLVKCGWRTAGKASPRQFAGRDDFHVVPIRFRSKNGKTWKSPLPATFNHALGIWS